MKTEKNIFIAFILNLAFSIFEFIGGIFTGSIAITSDAIHDMGDAASIGIAYFLEKKSKRQPNETYTYGYLRYSVIGGFFISFMLLLSSVIVIYNAVLRIIFPVWIDYNGVMVFAVIGFLVNTAAAFFTGGDGSLNQKAVNLHMLEDVMGWAAVLIGAVIMKFTGLALIDPIMSIGVAIFIFIHAAKSLHGIADLFLEKVPNGISTNDIKEDLSAIEGVIDVHHLHIRSIDGQRICATMHVVTDADIHLIKHTVREKLDTYGISHVTLELESPDEHCHERQCIINHNFESSCGHHH